ncbi:hypothetical protein JKF63_00086 [Porcisia hertigi]|uniref:RNase III domain-containing protein n=1 Tax=Porcisia hertigi TaxID=2761500 RepID=A0A836KY07_9TRYP|nr:hypothetical protein JKF63_00086 [Porcisia hertigi]
MYSLAWFPCFRRTTAWRARFHTRGVLLTHARDLVSASSTLPSHLTPPEPTKLFSSPMVQEWSMSAPQETVISRKALNRAERIVAEADDSRSEKQPFYDSDTRRCRVCDARLEGSYSSHIHSVDHKPRIALLKRTIGMILTFLEQVSLPPSSVSAEPTASFGGEKRVTRFAAAHAATFPTPAPSCFHALYTESPLFHEKGVPSRNFLHQCPSTLRELDMVDVIMRRWWNTLHRPPPKRGSLSFDRLLSLSSAELQARRWRLRYLLHFLKSRGVLRSSLSLRADESNLVQSASDRMHRGETFERLEMVGDCFFKSLTPDRMHTVFPADEGGLSQELQHFERTLDSNHGLLAIYDYLGLDDILGSFLANNKAKADVVEAVIGELKVLLWSTDVTWGMECYVLPGERATYVYLRALVAHTIAELGHTILMWQLESTLRNCREFILKHTVEEYLTPSKGNHCRVHATGDEHDFLSDLPKYAPLPPLLAWVQPRPCASLWKDEVPYLCTPVSNKVPPSPQDSFRSLAATASSIPEAIRKHYAVGQKKWTPEVCKSSVQALCGFSRPSALLSNRGVVVDALPLDSRCTSSLLYGEVQPFPTPPAHGGASDKVLQALVTANCVVIRD